MASATSKKTEIKLTGVARASLVELLQDYEDFLRQRGLVQWSKDNAHVIQIRQLAQTPQLPRLIEWGPEKSPDAAELEANTMVCLLNQAVYLLRRQLESLEQKFLEEGGFTEKMHRLRTERRSEKS